MERKYLPVVKSLSEDLDSPLLAFLLLCDVAEHSYGNLEFSVKCSGWGDTEDPFKRMDKVMVEVISLLALASNDTKSEGEEGKEGKEGFEVKPSKEDMGTEWDAKFAALNSLKEKIRRWSKQDNLGLRHARERDLRTLFARRREKRDKILETKRGGLGRGCVE